MQSERRTFRFVPAGDDDTEGHGRGLPRFELAAGDDTEGHGLRGHLDNDTEGHIKRFVVEPEGVDDAEGHALKSRCCLVPAGDVDDTEGHPLRRLDQAGGEWRLEVPDDTEGHPFKHLDPVGVADDTEGHRRTFRLVPEGLVEDTDGHRYAIAAIDAEVDADRPDRYVVTSLEVDSDDVEGHGRRV